MHPRLLLPIALAATFDTAAAPRGFIVAASPPTTNSEINAAAIDLDGDGTVDNQFGNFFAVLTQNANFDFAAPVSAGEIVYLLRLTSADATFADDPAAVAEWVVGEPTAPTPADFSGAGTFQLDARYPPAVFVGPLSSSVFQSPNPVTTTGPVDATLQLELSGRIVLPLNRARLAFTVTPGGLVSGQVNGSVTESDIQVILIPAFADEVNDRIAANDPSKDQLLGIFDDGCNGVGAGNGFVETCEVSDSLIGSLLVPDLTVLGSPGDPADSISFGMRFTAANATVPLEVVFANSFE